MTRRLVALRKHPRGERRASRTDQTTRIRYPSANRVALLDPSESSLITVANQSDSQPFSYDRCCMMLVHSEVFTHQHAVIILNNPFAHQVLAQFLPEHGISYAVHRACRCRNRRRGQCMSGSACPGRPSPYPAPPFRPGRGLVTILI